MTWKQFCALGLKLPDVEEGTSYGTPALKCRGKLLARLKEDGTTVVLSVETVDEQQFLIRAKPDVYFLTPHYEGYPLVLAHLPALRTPAARTHLESARGRVAPKRKSATVRGEKKGATAVRRSTRPK
ncbi:MmcQ/YjbR family DNA-binding protein [Melittangium boletus]|uniref:MmcQ/YjbR family DNA-binding protein n=1 Tax=Melittangium boletus DSM 14713 TaxID=1294270 RepID=A0A250IN30_9BACT|nr:hypothetical protein [Melittangium boletus]ATB33159.1 hypothetical protein MEBOL_006648 [Melittangium boletus DSM 14713]